MNEKQDCIDEIKSLRERRRNNPSVFYDMEYDQDLALEEIKARELGITDIELEA